MKPLIRFSLLWAVFMSSSALYANPESTNRPAFVRSGKFFTVIRNNEANKPVANGNAAPVAAKVCACQIMNVSSNNEQMEYVAVLSEKTNNGELNDSYSIAMSVVEKEKKQMKNRFYSKIKVLEKYTAYSSCQSLLGRLQVAHGELKVYEILDADILGSKFLTHKK